MCPDSCVPTGKIHPDEIAGEWLSDIELAAGWSAISLLVNDTCEGAYVSPGHTKRSHGSDDPFAARAYRWRWAECRVASRLV